MVLGDLLAGISHTSWSSQKLLMDWANYHSTDYSTKINKLHHESLLSHPKLFIGCIKDYCDGREAMVWVIWWLEAMQIKPPKQTLPTTVEKMVWVICQLDAKIKPQTLYRCRANFSTDHSRKTSKQQAPSHLIAHQSPSQPFKIIHYGMSVLMLMQEIILEIVQVKVLYIKLRLSLCDKLEVEVLKRGIDSKPG